MRCRRAGKGTSAYPLDPAARAGFGGAVATWHIGYDPGMKAIAQQELRNRSGEILRRAESGEQFIITLDGQPVAQLGPVARRSWVPKAELVRILRTGSPDPDFQTDGADLGGTLDERSDPR